MAYNLIRKFKKWNKEHKNFMTPDVISIKQKGNRIYELSEGTGFENEPIYGASELESIMLWHCLKSFEQGFQPEHWKLGEQYSNDKKGLADVLSVFSEL